MKKKFPMRIITIAVLCLLFTLPSCGKASSSVPDSNFSPAVMQAPPIRESVTKEFTSHNEVMQNPLIGFAPAALFIDSVGESTLVYVGITWRDWEPTKGQYDTAGIAQKFSLERWKNENRRIVLRFICDIPDAESSLDIPDWLYEETGKDGAWYDVAYGTGYSPNYDNSTFIQRHKLAIEALGRFLGKDTRVPYVQFGSIGHWGEWHVKIQEGVPRLPTEQVMDKYVQPYLKAFPNSEFLMRRPFKWVRENGMGVYNDMTGDPVDTANWLSWIENGSTHDAAKGPWKVLAVPEIWNTAPTGGEFTSGIPMENMLGANLNQTLQLLDKSHMSFIGQKIPRMERTPELTQSAINAVKNKIGYRFTIPLSTVSYPSDTSVNVELKWENMGVAPIYWDWPAYIYLLDESGLVLQKQQIDIALSSLISGGTISTNTELIFKDAPPVGTRIGVGIEDPATGKPGIRFATNCDVVDGIMVIGEY